MPTFSNTSAFPAFAELPASGSLASSSSSSPSTPWYLLAQIKENMTITQPTLIVTDRTGADFAVVFEDALATVGIQPGGFRGGGRFRKAHTLVVPRAAREERPHGKKAVVRVPRGEGAGVQVVPGPLDQLLELGLATDKPDVGTRCAACGDAEAGALAKCSGCGTAAYCSKECQVRGWSELGHKANCKVLRSIREIWP
ncbi:hypothetical protein F4780DRAFT_781124 [Xylariomycetidae sp. FL0641]|nr:hypothetical protein F4780DRAFT_781124 [Xylariomycetidae sp. FL0641]